MEYELIEQFTAELRARGRALDTCAEYKRYLTSFAQYLWAEGVFSLFAAEREHITAYYLYVCKGNFAAKTVWKKQHAAHAFYGWLRKKGYLLLNPAPVPVLQQLQALPRDIPEWATIRPLLERLDRSPRIWEQRDCALIDLAYSCGLRRCELHRLNVDDIDVRGATVRVRGKGSHERLVPIGERCLRAMLHYIYSVRPRLVKTGRTRALFVSWHQGGKRMHRYSINAIFRRLRAQHGLDRTMAPHKLRHAFATDLVRNGAPIQDVSRMLGHQKMDTTQIYTRLAPTELQRHHRVYHPRG